MDAKNSSPGSDNRVGCRIDDNESFNKNNYSDYNLFDFNTETIAETLSEIDARLLCAINWTELSKGQWTNSDKMEKCPNVVKMINFFNKCTSLFIWQIIKNDSSSQRAKMINKMIKLTSRLKSKYNMNSMRAVVACLQSHIIYNLPEWSKIKPKKLERLKVLVDSVEIDDNFFNNMLKCRNMEDVKFIPFLGKFLTKVLTCITINKEIKRRSCDALMMCSLNISSGLEITSIQNSEIEELERNKSFDNLNISNKTSPIKISNQNMTRGKSFLRTDSRRTASQIFSIYDDDRSNNGKDPSEMNRLNTSTTRSENILRATPHLTYQPNGNIAVEIAQASKPIKNIEDCKTTFESYKRIASRYFTISSDYVQMERLIINMIIPNETIMAKMAKGYTK